MTARTATSAASDAVFFDSKSRSGKPFCLILNYARDNLLTEFGKATLRDRYLIGGETFQEMFARVASWFADDQEHAQRIYDYISKLWFMPSTPVLSNGGTNRGLPISCFLNAVEDSLDSIVGTWRENAWLAARGGGIGTYWGDVREIGATVNQSGETSGIVPFIKVMDSLTLAISQGSLRRGSAAVYLDIDHPEIEEFIELRRPTGGDPNRKALNIHNAVNVTDAFMRAVERGEPFDLISRADGSVERTVDARALWARLLTARIETGEPYIVFTDTANAALPEHHKRAGFKIRQSNLCAEIMLPTSPERTAVCCLSSLNLEYFDHWSENEQIVEDVLRFLDNVLQDFIDRTEGVKGFEKARFSAMRERSVGLGVMGFHGYLQMHSIPFESVMAKVMNKRMFAWIRKRCNAASTKLADERGACPDAAEHGFNERFSNKLAVAPTASISIIAGNASPGIEPLAANSFTQKTLSGSFNVRNAYLEELLSEKYGEYERRQRGLLRTEPQPKESWLADVWSSITTNEGSVQHLEFLSQDEKDVFKTAFEIDQRWIIEHAADRTPFICQSQSVNIFLPADVGKRDLHFLHWMAWKAGVKSLYYCRSKSLARAERVTVDHMAGEMPQPRPVKPTRIEYDECLACQ